MKELHSEIEIEASAERVWKVLTNIAAFPQWNPFIRRASGEIRTGERLEVHMQPSGAKAMTFRPKVLKVEPNRELRWRGQLWVRGLFDGEHIFTIENIAPARVRFVQREQFSGVLVPLLARSLDRDTKRGFDEMNQALKSQAEKTSIPDSYWIGEELDWQASTAPVELYVELPYWLMVPDCVQDVEVNGHEFLVDIGENFVELYAHVVLDSRSTCLYIGPPQGLRPDLLKAIKRSKATVMSRKCKTVLRIHSDCNKDALAASRETGRRRRAAYAYLTSFCEAHFDVVNRLIQQYRLATYDYFAYELSPWDIPMWFVKMGLGFDTVKIILQDYLTWDRKPMIVSGKTRERYKLIDPSKLQTALTLQPSAGEFDLMDALNLMERGNYSDAVRRITTAIETQTEFALRQELLKKHSLPDVEKRLKASENDFPGRLRQYQKLSDRKLSDALAKELDITRALRHSIVHDGKRIPFNERGRAQKAVDTGRWIFDWLENQPARFDVREKKIGKRSLGRHFSLYHSEITPAGVVVHKPPF